MNCFRSSVLYLCSIIFFVSPSPDNGPLCTTPLYQHTVSEAALQNTPLLRVSASDPDLTSKPQFSISGQGSEFFDMNAKTGQLSIGKKLDRETQSHFSLQVTVRDGGNLDWYCTCQIEVDVTDVNDNPPVFSVPSYSINVPENSPENILLLKVHASDPDQGKVFIYITVLWFVDNGKAFFLLVSYVRWIVLGKPFVLQQTSI